MTASSKPGAKTDREALRRRLTELGAATQLVAAEFQRRFGFRPREAWRHAHGWSQDETADSINALLNRSGVAAPVPIARSRIGDYERWPYGGRRPSPVFLATLAAVFGASPLQLLDADDLAHMPAEERRLILATSGTATPSQLLSHAWPKRAATDALDLRSLLGNASGEDDLVAIIEQHGAEFAAWAESTNVGSTTIDTLFTAVRRIATDYLTSAPMPLYVRASEFADRTWRLLTGHQSTCHTRDLFLAAGQLYALLAWMSGDLGRHAAADTHARTAWLCAEQADNNDLRAWTLSAQAKTAFWDRRFLASAELARRGHSYARTGASRILLAHQEADALARLGAEQETLKALHQAQDEAGQRNGYDDIGGLWSCGPVRQANYASAVLLTINHTDEALVEASRGISAFEHGDRSTSGYGTVAQLRINTAHAHARAGRPDGAAVAVQPVLDLPIDQRLDTVRTRLGDLVSELSQPHLRGSVEALSLRDAIEDWRSSAPMRAIER